MLTYREWVMENRELSAPYLRSTIKIEDCKREITEIKKQITAAERGDLPSQSHSESELVSAFSDLYMNVYYSTVAEAMDVDPETLKRDERSKRWEREALEAETERQKKVARFLENYRDGKCGYEKHEPFSGSLPWWEQRLNKLTQELADYQPEPPFDPSWRTEDEVEDAWYDEAPQVLQDMLFCLGCGVEFEYFEQEAYRVITDLSHFGYGFKFGLWITDYGETTCHVTNRHIPGAKLTARGVEEWPILEALIEFIDANWGALLSAMKELAEKRAAYKLLTYEEIEAATREAEDIISRGGA